MSASWRDGKPWDGWPLTRVDRAILWALCLPFIGDRVAVIVRIISRLRMKAREKLALRRVPRYGAGSVEYSAAQAIAMKSSMNFSAFILARIKEEA